jgi:hypothetical protein
MHSHSWEVRCRRWEWLCFEKKREKAISGKLVGCRRFEMGKALFAHSWIHPDPRKWEKARWIPLMPICQMLISRVYRGSKASHVLPMSTIVHPQPAVCLFGSENRRIQTGRIKNGSSCMQRVVIFVFARLL